MFVLQVHDDERGSVVVKGLRRVIVNSEEEALALLFQGEQNRAVGEHQMNKNSTRSHCIFTIYIQQRSRIESSAKVIHSKLNVVDLAGSTHAHPCPKSALISLPRLLC